MMRFWMPSRSVDLSWALGISQLALCTSISRTVFRPMPGCSGRGSTLARLNKAALSSSSWRWLRRAACPYSFLCRVKLPICISRNSLARRYFGDQAGSWSLSKRWSDYWRLRTASMNSPAMFIKVISGTRSSCSSTSPTWRALFPAMRELPDAVGKSRKEMKIGRTEVTEPVADVGDGVFALPKLTRRGRSQSLMPNSLWEAKAC